ncbi:MAG TPA: carbohydrate ABC transporter permease [Candidatus Dormibacteraeota bacterium]|nr:carbohydrate ABC transporter permease [Candidatus Dormibacteraeota bacterium]
MASTPATTRLSAIPASSAPAVPAVRRWRTPRGRRRLGGQVLFYLGVLIVLLIALFPFYWILRTSLESNAEFVQGVGGANGLIPSHLTLSSYIDDFTQLHFLTPLLNSAIVAFGTTVVTIVVASLAGYALARLPIRGGGAILTFVLLAGFFPVLAMVGPLFLLYRDLGLLNNIYPLIITYLVYTLPLSTWLLRNFFAQIPKELEEAALVDGASRLQTLRKVVIPVSIPAVFTAGILSFILAWNDFAFALSFLDSPSKFTAPLAIVVFGQSQYETFFNRIDAAVVVITIPIAILVLIAQRRIVSGLTAGSLKG